MKKTAAAVATVVIVCSLFTHCVSAKEIPVSERVLQQCQEQLSEEVALCKLMTAGAEECFLEAVDHANDCTTEGGRLALLTH